MQHHDELTPRSLAGKRTIHEGCMPQLRQLGTYSCLPSSAHWSPCSIGRPMTTSVQSAIYAESRALGHQIQAIKHGLLSQKYQLHDRENWCSVSRSVLVARRQHASNEDRSRVQETFRPHGSLQCGKTSDRETATQVDRNRRDE